jgi:hypothetical protein
MGFLDKEKIKFAELVDQTNQFLVNKYRQTLDVFSPSSAFGQILSVVDNYVKLILFYIEDSITELNIYKATKTDSVYGLARLAGHNPTRSISAQGALGIKIKQGASLDIESNFFFIDNFMPIKNKSNGLDYLFLLDSDRIRISKNSNDLLKLRVIQGKVESQTRSSDGEELQSYNIFSRGAGEIENEYIWIYVNGEKYDVVDSLYDMNKDQKACIVKTAISDGIDIYFGNEDYGTIPPTGATIKIEYVISAGAAGVLNSKAPTIEWEFLDDAYGVLGDEIDLNEIMHVSIQEKFLLGSDGEDVNLTRLIAGSNSKSLVLAHPRNYIHFLSRYDQFGFIDAYTTFDDEYLDDDNVIYLFLIPNVQKRIDTNSEYFTTDINNFYLDPEEKASLKKTIQQSGRQIVTTELKIEDAIIKQYLLNIYLRVFDTADEQLLKADITARLGEYFLNVKRRDKIPKSDIIEILEGVEGVDSVNVKFIARDNEEAIKNGYYWKTTFKVDATRSIKEPIREKITLQAGEDPHLGLDEFGDIVIGKNQLPLIRGGWSDRNDVMFEDGSADSEFSSLNIIVKETIIEDINSQIARRNKQEVKKSF